MASKISEDELKTTMKYEVLKTEDTSDNVEDDKFQETVEEHMQKTRKQFEMVKSKSDQAYKLWKQDFEFLESKRKNFTEMSQKLKDVHFNDIVKLNVGGEKFETTLETLTKFPNSLFGKMFSGCMKLKQGSDGTYFIDRDGNQFRSILNFLRRRKVSSHMRENAEELIEEAQFYGLESFVGLLLDQKGDKALNKEEKLIDDGKDQMTIEEHTKQSREALDEAESQLKDGHASLKEDLSFLDGKRENFLEMAKKLRNVHFADVIKLNVGGQIFETSLSTLQKEPDSMLAAMFSKRFEPLKQKDGAYFIDRDGTLFRHILNYLRMGKISRDTIEEIGNDLLMEAEFYNLQGLLDTIVSTNYVKINAGGEIYTASIATMRRDPDSLFAKMLTGNGGKVFRVNGVYVFEDPVKHMKELLMFLREGSLSKNVVRSESVGLLSDAEYFNVQTLIHFIDDSFGLEASSIIGDDPDYQLQLRSWLEEREMKTNPFLLYSAEDDGWTAAKFHQRCDGKGPTLVLIESEHGCIFGGLTHLSWAINGWSPDAKSFLFSLKSKEWNTPVIMPSNSNLGCIYGENRSYGPIFGKTNYTVLGVANSPNTNQCSSKYEGCYSYPSSVPHTHTFLAGAQSFLIKRLEVYAV